MKEFSVSERKAAEARIKDLEERNQQIERVIQDLDYYRDIISKFPTSPGLGDILITDIDPTTHSAFIHFLDCVKAQNNREIESIKREL